MLPALRFVALGGAPRAHCAAIGFDIDARGETLFGAGREEVWRWDLAAERFRWRAPTDGEGYPHLALRPDGSRLALGFPDPPRLEVRELASGALLRALPLAPALSIHQLAWLGSSDRLAMWLRRAGTPFRLLFRVVDLGTGETAWEVEEDALYQALPSPDGTAVAMRRKPPDGARVDLAEGTTGRLEWSVPVTPEAVALAWAADGRLLYVSSAVALQGRRREDGALLWTRRRRGLCPEHALLIAPGGGRLARRRGSQGLEILTADGEGCGGRGRAHEDPHFEWEWSSSGAQLITYSHLDLALRVWDGGTARLLTDLSADPDFAPLAVRAARRAPTAAVLCADGRVAILGLDRIGTKAIPAADLGAWFCPTCRQRAGRLVSTDLPDCLHPAASYEWEERYRCDACGAQWAVERWQ